MRENSRQNSRLPIGKFPFGKVSTSRTIAGRVLSVFVAALVVCATVPALQAQGDAVGDASGEAPDATRQSIKPIHERMPILLDEHYERFDSTASYSEIPERMKNLLLAAEKTERHNYRGTAVDHDGNEYQRGFDLTIFHFKEEHELKFAVTALYRVYGIDHRRLHQSARAKKSTAPPFILIGAGTTLTLVSAPCDAFRVKSEWLDFSELVRTLTIQARTVCVNDCKGPVYLY